MWQYHFNKDITERNHFFSVMYRATSSASADYAIKYFIICAMVNIRPLSFGVRSFSDRNINAPDWLQAFDSLRNTASECAASIIFLARKSIP